MSDLRACERAKDEAHCNLVDMNVAGMLDPEMDFAIDQDTDQVVQTFLDGGEVHRGTKSLLGMYH